jgi:hypothetical protein
MSKSDLQKHINKLIEQHGGLRAAARATGVDPGYLWRMKSGRDDGSDQALEKLGLKRTETLRPL